MSTLVAGIGNIFLGDDGFGVEVVRRLSATALPADVDVADYGIRGVHLAYDLLDSCYQTLVLVDAVPVAEPPGTIVVLDVTETAAATGPVTVNAHAMGPDVVLQALHDLGGRIDKVLVVGCRPAVLEEQLGLSDVVAAAVDETVRAIVDLVSDSRIPEPIGHTPQGRPSP